MVAAGARPVSAARSEILARIRTALGPTPSVPEVQRSYRGAGGHGEAGSSDVVDLFCERVSDYGVTVRRIRPEELDVAVSSACAQRGVRRLVTPVGFPVPTDVGAIADDPPLSATELDALDGALTGCAVAIAETGTIALDGGPRSGRRALTLVPDYHLCIVEAHRILASVPDAVAALEEVAREGRPITWISGPSATSDIELERVQGVHGPRTLDVLVVLD
jgi:L-lactate dehydrogenase complex protein LldG